MKSNCKICGMYCDLSHFATPSGDFTVGLCDADKCNAQFKVHLHKAIHLNKFDAFKKFYNL